MKPMMPSLKEKKRYAAVCFYNPALTYEDMKEVIKDSFKEMFGTVGYAKARPLFLKSGDSCIIVRVNHQSLNDLRVAVLNIKKTGNTKLLAQIKFVSGSLRKLREKFLK